MYAEHLRSTIEGMLKGEIERAQAAPPPAPAADGAPAAAAPAAAAAARSSRRSSPPPPPPPRPRAAPASDGADVTTGAAADAGLREVALRRQRSRARRASTATSGAPPVDAAEARFPIEPHVDAAAADTSTPDESARAAGAC